MKQTWTTPGGPYNPLYADFLEQDNLLIAGTKGSGKSCVINSIMSTALLDSPVNKQFILIDPKRTELREYKPLPHTILYAAEDEELIPALQYSLDIINKRFDRMQREHKRDWTDSHIYIIIDELMYLMIRHKCEALPLLQQILCISRASGVSTIAATQNVTREILPGTLKCNFDSRLGLRTATKQESRNILDVNGCEDLPDPKREGKALGIYRRGTSITTELLTLRPQGERESRIEYWTQAKPTTDTTPATTRRKRGILAWFTA